MMRSMMKAWILGLSVLVAAPAGAQPVKKVERFRLLDQNGVSHALSRYAYAKALVLITQGNGCGIIRQSVPGIKALRERYAKDNVVFLMLNANPQDSREEIAKEAASYGIDLPILKDDTQAVARSLGLTRTAEALLIDPVARLVKYRGVIDEKFGYGVRKALPAKEPLAAAIADFLAGRPVAVPETEALGCLITFPKPRELSYVKDAAPILRRRCLTCHDARNSMAWPMKDYEHVKGWSSMIREVLMTRRMPPWHADPAYGKFKNDISLPPEERSALIEWVEAGAERGEGDDPLAGRLSSGTARWPLGTPDLILSMKKPQQVPAAGTLEPRMIPLGGAFDKELLLSNVIVRPGNLGVVHHSFIYLANEPVVEHEGPPYFFESDSIGGWAPGLERLPLPDGVAESIPKGLYPALQMHYVPSGREESDATEVGLYFYKGKKKPRQIYHKTIKNWDILIPAGERAYAASQEGVFEKESWLTGLMPHMHYRGKSMRFTALYPDGRREVLLSVPDYDFDWQRFYQFVEPKRVPAGTRLVIDAVYDNSRENPANPDPKKVVRYGRSTEDEMFYTETFYYE